MYVRLLQQLVVYMGCQGGAGFNAMQACECTRFRGPVSAAAAVCVAATRVCAADTATRMQPASKTGTARIDGFTRVFEAETM